MDQCTVKSINDHIWLFRDEHYDTCYLIAGKEKAMLIDTMCGYVDIREQAEKLTDLPIIVVNTHGHGDHIMGNISFEEAYMHPADFFMVESTVNHPDFKAVAEKQGFQMSHFLPTKEGDKFDLGGLTVEVFELPGHSPGGICLLLREDRILFTGDSINRFLWMQLEGCMSISEYAHQLERLLPLQEKADTIFHGHATDPDSICLISELLHGLRDLAAGHTENDNDYEWFCGISKKHPFAENSYIVYDPATLH